MRKINKLYRVYSEDETQNGDKICIEYFYAEKKWDAVNYDEIVKDYSDMDSEDKKHSEILVNEMFTYDEVGILQAYFKEEHGIELIVKEQSIPIIAIDKNEHGKVWMATLKNIKDFYKDMEPYCEPDIVSFNNNGLPFKVAGIRGYC
jgi:hypothetical protein